MCNFIPLRNLLIALGILAGAAATSAIFALLWERFGGYPPVTKISFSAAAAWAIAAIVLLGFAVSALTTFCTCAAAIAACATACSSMAPLLRTLLGLLIGLFAVCLVQAADLFAIGEVLVVATVVAAAGTLTVIGSIAFYSSRLGACQGP